MSQNQARAFFFTKSVPKEDRPLKTSSLPAIQKQRRAVGHSVHLPTRRGCNQTTVTGAARKRQPTPQGVPGEQRILSAVVPPQRRSQPHAAAQPPNESTRLAEPPAAPRPGGGSGDGW